jgi:hypothetical protein
MTRSPISHLPRRAAAQAALDALGPSPAAHTILAVQCTRSHHVAAVYSSPDGMIFSSVVRRHAHGDRDRFDAHHHGHGPQRHWVDFLLPGTDADLDDDLPAGCECGRRTLSRAVLAQAIREGERRVLVG